MESAKQRKEGAFNDNEEEGGRNWDGGGKDKEDLENEEVGVNEEKQKEKRRQG